MENLSQIEVDSTKTIVVSFVVSQCIVFCQFKPVVPNVGRTPTRGRMAFWGGIDAA